MPNTAHGHVFSSQLGSWNTSLRSMLSPLPHSCLLDSVLPSSDHFVVMCKTCLLLDFSSERQQLLPCPFSPGTALVPVSPDQFFSASFIGISSLSAFSSPSVTVGTPLNALLISVSQEIFFQRLLKMCYYFYVCVCTCVQMPMEARRGSSTPWSCLWATM